MIVIRDIEQSTDEWAKLRCGIPTASMFGKILTPTGLASTQKKEYMYKLAEERITGVPTDNYMSQDMLYGKIYEDEACSAFEAITDIELEQVAFCYHDSEAYGCSPDRLAKTIRIGLEVKCPKGSTHIQYLDENKLPTKYIPQVQGSLLVSGYEYWYFMSYHPDFQSLILKVERDEEYICKLADSLLNFCNELDDLVERIRK